MSDLVCVRTSVVYTIQGLVVSGPGLVEIGGDSEAKNFGRHRPFSEVASSRLNGLRSV